MIDRFIRIIEALHANNSRGKALMLAFIMLFSLTACKSNNTNTNTQAIVNEQLINEKSNEGTPLPKLSTTTSETSMNTEFATPEIAEESENENYFFFLPTEEELRLIEKEAEDLSQRLKMTKTENGNGLALGNYTAFDMTRILTGDFSQELINYEEDVETTRISIYHKTTNFVGGFTIRVMQTAYQIYNDKFTGIIENPEFYKVFSIAGSDRYPGADILKSFEEEAQEIYQAGLNKNDSLFEDKSKKLMKVIISLLNKEDKNDEGVSNFYKMHPIVKLVLLENMKAATAYISGVAGYNIKADEASEDGIYVLYDLVFSEEINNLVMNEIFTLVDAYMKAA